MRLDQPIFSPFFSQLNWADVVRKWKKRTNLGYVHYPDHYIQGERRKQLFEFISAAVAWFQDGD